MSSNEENTLRIKSYRAERRTDPSDGKGYTWTTMAEWYGKQGWSVRQINEYWNSLEPLSLGRTRTKKKQFFQTTMA